jgi:hypothetical protein
MVLAEAPTDGVQAELHAFVKLIVERRPETVNNFEQG